MFFAVDNGGVASTQIRRAESAEAELEVLRARALLAEAQLAALRGGQVGGAALYRGAVQRGGPGGNVGQGVRGMHIFFI
jgi:hypothetical protein